MKRKLHAVSSYVEPRADKWAHGRMELFDAWEFIGMAAIL